MTLPPGRRIGVYEISGLIGEGGMGQVYRARDTTLHRDVALKVLPEFFVTDPERLARFRREALTLAALNHPNIAQVFGIEESGDVHALAMELADGEDLFHRLQRGAIPLDEALPIARQIAAALEAAHERGIIHRDLKPSNIKLRPDGTVKVLDFGLAKAADLAAAASRDLSQSPTITSPAMTRAGMILGTAAYMSPEQAKGRPVDKRADVWAFGCVLFEMLTGVRAFPGDDLSETLASVLKGEPDFALLAAKSSPACVTVVRACLQRDLNRRVRDIGDVMLALDGAFASAPTAPAVVAPAPSFWTRYGMPLAAAALLIVVALGVLSLMVQPAMPRRERVHLALNLPASDRLVPADSFAPGGSLTTGTTMTLSPDGHTLVYSAVHDGVQQLYRRSLGDVDPVFIPGTVGGSVPFFSPDGRWLGFVVNRTLKKMLLPDGVPVTLQTHSLPIVEASWGDDGQIALGGYAANDVMFTTPSEGGSIEPLTKAGHPNGRLDRKPEYLPGSRGVLFIGVPDAYVHVLRTGEDKLVVKDAEWVRYLPTGHLLFGRRSTVFAAVFDLEQFAIIGDPVPVVGAASGPASVGRNGTMIYQTGEAILGHTFVWVDRSGREEPLAITQCRCSDPTISADGKTLAVSMANAGGVINADVYTYDLVRGGGFKQLTVNANAGHPAWTPDGRHVGFVMYRRDGQATFGWRAADGTGPVEELVKGGDPAFEGVWTPDGQTLLVVPVSPKTLGDILQVPRGGRGEPTALIQGTAWDYAPRVSPDGRWLAYTTTESGKHEIYVRSYPDVNAGSWKVSVDGGWDPRWSTKGDELYYGHEGKMYRVGVEPGATFSFTTPEVLFSGDLVWPIGRHAYDVARDGRFLMMKNVRGNVSIQVVLNWLDELKERVPVRSAR